MTNKDDLSHSKQLYALCKEQQQLNKSLQQQLAEQTKQITTQTKFIIQLQKQIEQLQRLLYGKKSEQRKSSSQDDNDHKNGHDNPNQKKSQSSNRNGRSTIPDNIEREKVVHELPKEERQCQRCGQALKPIGCDITEQLEYVPAKLIVKQHARCKYGCPHCKQSIVLAPLPPQPIDKGFAGPGLLSELIISKYQDALPLYRQEQRWKRLGYVLPRSSQCDWVMQCASLLAPLVDRMTQDCKRSLKIHTDDTPFYVQQPGKTHTGRFWVYVGGDGRAPPCVIYEYSQSRSQTIPLRFFEGYQGYIQADAYPGYDKLFKNKSIIEVGCMAHARRKFIEVNDALKNSAEAEIALDFIGKLYAIEKRAKDMTYQQRYALRRHDAKPLLKQFRRWLQRQQKKQLPKSPLGKAIAYMLNHWQALTNYLRDGRLNIDNNAAERAVKPVVIGRKNYLFAGSHDAAHKAAVLYSIIETCKLNDVNTFDYLKDVLTRLPTTLNKDIDSLLPYYWKSQALP